MADDSTNGTIDQHLEDIGSPGTKRTLRRVRRAKDSQSANPPTGSQLWDNANAAITSRHQQPQQPQQQRTREQRTSAAEQELVLTAAAICRSATARARLNGTDANDDSNGIDDDGSNPSILDGLEMNDVMNNDAAMMEVIDENNNGTFIIDGIDYCFCWKNWSNWFAVPPPSY